MSSEALAKEDLSAIFALVSLCGRVIFAKKWRNEAVLVRRSLGEGGMLRFIFCGYAAKCFMCRRHASYK